MKRETQLKLRLARSEVDRIYTKAVLSRGVVGNAESYRDDWLATRMTRSPLSA